MPIRRMSGLQLFPLSTGVSDAVAFSAGGPLKFQLGNLPKSLGKLAYYLYGIFVTFSGTVTQAGGTGVLIPDARLYSLLIDYLSLGNAWHGAPLSPQHVKGFWLPTILPVATGYNLAMPATPSIPAANGATAFEKTMFIPLCLGNGERTHHSAQLNVLYRQAFFEIGCAPAAALTAFSPGATFSGITVRASAGCMPEPEIRVGPGVEWVDYQTSAQAGGNQVLLQSFGNATQLLNTEAGAAVAFAMAMSSNQGQPGSFDPVNVTQISIPFRNQTQINHITPFVAAQIASMGPRRSLGTGSAIAVGGLNDTQDFPYAQNFAAEAAGANLEMAGLLGIPLVPQPTDMQTSKLQVVSGDTSYFLTMSSGPSGTHHTLVQHIRSWAPQGFAEALKIIQDSRLISDVFGNTSGELAWSVKTGNGKSPSEIAPAKLRFLPLALKPKSSVERRQARR